MSADFARQRADTVRVFADSSPAEESVPRRRHGLRAPRHVVTLLPSTLLALFLSLSLYLSLYLFLAPPHSPSPPLSLCFSLPLFLSPPLALVRSLSFSRALLAAMCL